MCMPTEGGPVHFYLSNSFDFELIISHRTVLHISLCASCLPRGLCGISWNPDEVAIENNPKQRRNIPGKNATLYPEFLNSIINKDSHDQKLFRHCLA